jgi:hypothetical protein
MPPKKQGVNSATKRLKRASDLPEPSQQQRTALTSMFANIESKDSTLQQCHLCQQRIKSCLFNDHLATKCPNRIGLFEKKENVDDIVFLYSNSSNKSIITKKVNSPQQNVKTEHKEPKLEVENSVSTLTYENNVKLEEREKTPSPSFNSSFAMKTDGTRPAKRKIDIEEIELSDSEHDEGPVKVEDKRHGMASVCENFSKSSCLIA